MTKELKVANNTLNSISKETGFSNKDIEVMKNTVFSTLETESQVILALKVARMYDLNPFAKEFWGWLDNKGKLITIASASGFMKIARKQKGFISIEAHAIFKGEDFSLNTGTGEVSHIIKPNNRGEKINPVGAYSRLRMEGKKDVVKYVDWDQYQKQTNKFNSPWNNNRNAMIEKVAITVLCREQFGLSGLYGEEEMESTMSKGKNISNDVDKEELAKKIAEREDNMLKKEKIRQDIEEDKKTDIVDGEID